MLECVLLFLLILLERLVYLSQICPYSQLDLSNRLAPDDRGWDGWMASMTQWTSVQFSSVTQSCLTLCDPMNCSTPGLPVHHRLQESTQAHVHWVGDAIQPSHPLLPPSPPALNPSQHQDLFQWVSSSHQVAKISSQWTRVWANPGSWWRTGKPRVLQSMRLQSQTQLRGWIPTTCHSRSCVLSIPCLTVASENGNKAPWKPRVVGT